MDLRDIEPNARPPRRHGRARTAAPVRGTAVVRPGVLTPFGPAGRGLGAWRASDASPAAAPAVHEIDAVVVGAGQAGLATAYHLQRAGFRGFAPALGNDAAHRAVDPTYVVLDAEDGPGGAWQHRWESLTMETVNGITDLPGAALEDDDPAAPARYAVTQYFTDYEDAFDLAVLRPVRVVAVERMEGSARLRVRTDGVEWHARAVVAASGTWGRPFWPYVPGHEDFRGRQVHTHDFVGARQFQDQRVVVVGGGISAVGHLLEISDVADTLWVTRRPPEFRTTPFDDAAGRRVEQAVRARVERGLRPRSVVSETGLLRTPAVEQGLADGVLERHPMFHRIEADGVRWADGSTWQADAIVWATGFRPDVPYLRPLRLRTPLGGFRMEGTQVAGEPRLHFVGLGPDSSTIGARRSARHAASALRALVDGR